MVLWRISNYADLSGIGGTLAPGRWHSRGRAIVYAAEHPALALLESLAHFDRGEMPERFQLLGIEIDDALLKDNIAQPRLPKDWARDYSATRRIGDKWLRTGERLLLRVPSALAPHSWNLLINPAHRESANARIISRDLAPLDTRLA